MSSAPRFAYRRLVSSQDDEFESCAVDHERVKSRSWLRLRARRRRLRVKVPSLTRFLRRKLKSIPRLRGSLAKVLNRFKEGQAHLGDLFAGNYLFMQINPASFKTLHRSYAALPHPRCQFHFPAATIA